MVGFKYASHVPCLWLCCLVTRSFQLSRVLCAVLLPRCHRLETVPTTPAQVLDSCLGMGVPTAGYVGGGYASDLDVLAERHCWLHRAAAQLWHDHGL